MWKTLPVFGVVVIVAFAALARPVRGKAPDPRPRPRVSGLNLDAFSPAAPADPIDLAFLHHSVGAQLLAAPGPIDGSIDGYPTHPNGGNLAALLAANGYRLHEATYGSRLGEHTDLFDWLPKFRANMDDILALAHQNDQLPAGERNRVVVFKSCFPNNRFVTGLAGEPDPLGPELTLRNAQAAMAALRGELARRPDVLFVYVTAPPLAAPQWLEPSWKRYAKRLLNKPTLAELDAESAGLARAFNTWVKDPAAGWLASYQGRNIVVFDLHDLLTDSGASDYSRYASLDGTDSHPSSGGNAKAAAAFVPFLNRAVRYAGVTVSR